MPPCTKKKKPKKKKKRGPPRWSACVRHPHLNSRPCRVWCLQAVNEKGRESEEDSSTQFGGDDGPRDWGIEGSSFHMGQHWIRVIINRNERHIAGKETALQCYFLFLPIRPCQRIIIIIIYLFAPSPFFSEYICEVTRILSLQASSLFIPLG